MALFPCCDKSLCVDAASPVANLTAEASDGPTYIGLGFPWLDANNPVGGNTGDNLPVPTYFAGACTTVCESQISQQDADLCAARAAKVCGGASGPPTVPVVNFFSNLQACNFSCPDGSIFTYRVFPGAFVDTTQAGADDQAAAFACQVGAQYVICLSNIPGACVNQVYSASIVNSGPARPLTFSIVAGAVPPGLTFVQDTNHSALITGVPTVGGNFSFTVRAQDNAGNSLQKVYNLAVFGLSTPTDATQGSPYTFSFTVTGGTAPYTFSITSGALPTGLTMSSSGSITGTATGSGTSDFTVQVSDSTGATCSIDESINVTATCNCLITDWVANPGSCRLRLTAASYHDGILLTCLNATPSALPPWDGTMPVFAGQYLSATNAPTTVSVSGHKFTGCNLVFTGTLWSLGIAGDSLGIGNGMWIGQKAGLCPIGDYTFLLGCVAQPVLTLTVEAYIP